MNHPTSAKMRKTLKLEMAKIFCDKIQMLSPDLQKVLIDDLVTAFENRLSVLNRANLTFHCMSEATEDVVLETVKT